MTVAEDMLYRTLIKELPEISKALKTIAEELHELNKEKKNEG